MDSASVRRQLFLPHEIAKAIVLEGQPPGSVLLDEGGDTPSASGTDGSDDSHASETEEEEDFPATQPSSFAPQEASTQSDEVAAEPRHEQPDSVDPAT